MISGHGCLKIGGRRCKLYVQRMSKQQERDASRDELWIGLAKVEQSSSNGVLGGADRAYTNAIAIADSRVSFRTKVREALAELGLRLMLSLIHI